MNAHVIKRLLCPDSGSARLTLDVYREQDGQVIEGRVISPDADRWYRIENGVLDLLPSALRRTDLYAAFAVRHGLSFEPDRPLAKPDMKQGQIGFFRDHAGDYGDKVEALSLYSAFNQSYLYPYTDAHLRSGDVVLDLGAGTGEPLFALARRNIRGLCVDIAEEMLATGFARAVKQGLAAHMDFIVGDAEAPPVREQSVRMCLFLGALHHLPHPDQAVLAAAGKLEPGGYLHSQDPHNSPVRFLFDALMRVWTLYEEEARDDPLLRADQLTAWLTAAGLQASTTYAVYFPPHLFNFMGPKGAGRLLRGSDRLLRRIPGIRRWAGYIVAQGHKPNPEGQRP